VVKSSFVLLSNFVLNRKFSSSKSPTFHILTVTCYTKRPTPNDEKFQKREKWTMARCGWHWVSFDLLFATIGLGLINFTNYFDNEITQLQILTIYFLGYALVWALTIAISKQFPKNYLKLGQWILLFFISGLIYFGTNI